MGSKYEKINQNKTTSQDTSNLVIKNFDIIFKYINQTLVFKAKQIIFSVGDTPLGLYIVKSGRVKIESISENGHSHSLRLIGSQSLLGYRSLLGDEPYAASAVALEPTELYLITKADFFNLIKDNPDLAFKILKQLSDDLKLAEEKWTIQIDKTAAARIAEALIFLDSHFANKRWTRKEIADWAGTTPETVMRTLAIFEDEDLIEQSNRLIHIKNIKKLKQQCNELT